MPKGKIQNLFPDKYELKKKLEEDWQFFVYRDTYLLSEEKQNYFKEINQLAKFPRSAIFNFKMRGGVRRFRKDLRYLLEEINNFNKLFVENRLKEHSSFFDGKDDGLKYPLDVDQRLAVVKDGTHNLVIAGAGSGKTSVISSRIAYLIRRKDRVDKERILALAFTKVAADEMQERLKKNYAVEIDISTFHALGRSIIEDELGHKPKLLFDGNEKKQYELIQNLFMDVLKEARFQKILIEYLAYHSEQEVKKESFEDKEEYYKYMNNKNYTTLNDINVKSISERDIGNFFFLHNIQFEYEPLVEWVDESEEDKEYHPDFYLPDYIIYIEHWGLNKDKQVPDWFTITTEEYLELREWKLEQFEKYNKTLIETWDYERLSEDLIPKLKEKLKLAIPNVAFIPLTYDELIEKTSAFKEKRNEVVNLVGNFIKISKSNFFMVQDIQERIKEKKYSKKQKLFGELALEVYKRYQDYLNKENRIDFNDMINLAVKLTKLRPEKYIDRYDHVLVDEFQDVSYQRLELIKCFVNENSNTKLFCVGDDWQSIYQFTGSDVRFFVNFKDYFPNPEITYLNSNYRSSQTIVGMSNELIANNSKQIAKETRSTHDVGMQPMFIERKLPKLIDVRLANKNDKQAINTAMTSWLHRYWNNIKRSLRLEKPLILVFECENPDCSKQYRFTYPEKTKLAKLGRILLRMLPLTDEIVGFISQVDMQFSVFIYQSKQNKHKLKVKQEIKKLNVSPSEAKFLYKTLFGIEDNNSRTLDETFRWIEDNGKIKFHCNKCTPFQTELYEN